MSSYTVHARWDPASATWWTDGEDIPGLTCQADSFDELVDVIFELGPELLRDNGIEPIGQSVEISVVAGRRATPTPGSKPGPGSGPPLSRVSGNWFKKKVVIPGQPGRLGPETMNTCFRQVFTGLCSCWGGRPPTASSVPDCGLS